MLRSRHCWRRSPAGRTRATQLGRLCSHSPRPRGNGRSHLAAQTRQSPPASPPSASVDSIPAPDNTYVCITVSLYHCIIVDRSRYVCIPQRTYQRTICPKDTRPKHGPIALSWRGRWRFACLGLWDNPASPVIPLLFATVLWLDGERRWCGSVSAPDSHGLTLLDPNLHQIITCNTYVVKQQHISHMCVM